MKRGNIQSNLSYNNSYLILKELGHEILSHFFDGLNYGESVAKPKNNGMLSKKNTKGAILKQKGTRMVEDCKD